MGTSSGMHLSPDGQWWWSGSEWLPAVSADGKQTWNGKRWVHRGPSASRVTVLLMVVGAGIASIYFILDGLLGGMYFEPTSAAVFTAYATAPYRSAGILGLLVTVVGLVSWFLARRWHPLTAVSAALAIVATVVLVWGHVVANERRHPDAKIRSALTSLAFPSNFIERGTSLFNDAASFEYLPAGSRTWDVEGSVPRACTTVAVELSRWADRGSVSEWHHPADGPESCQFTADYRGFAVSVTLGARSRQSPHQLVVKVEPMR